MQTGVKLCGLGKILGLIYDELMLLASLGHATRDIQHGVQTMTDDFFERNKLERKSFFQDRRNLIMLGAVGGAAAAYGYWRYHEGAFAPDSEVIQSGKWWDSSEQAQIYLAEKRDKRFSAGRRETPREAAARFTNFYEFSRTKSCWQYVDLFEPRPWKVTIGGLCKHPITLDLDDLLKKFKPEMSEREYRHRCVERWAMAISWTGFPLAKLLEMVEPTAAATHVKFTSFHRPEQAPRQGDASFPWPYMEGLTLEEARNELTLLATGMYGEPLLRQHGAPLRLVVPWKYGYKSIKSIDKIELVGKQPATFWSTINPKAYPFESNVDPAVPVPWDQSTERMLGKGEEYKTEKFNGYGEWVAKMYR